MKKKILITGSTGFIGSNILGLLLKKNIHIYDVLRNKNKNNKNINKLKNNKNYHPIFYKKFDELEKKIKKVKGDVTFKNISFSYDNQIEVLRDINFFAPQGSVTALVGSSGSGKSTIAGLVTAFSNPTVGQVLIDGKINILHRWHMPVLMADLFKLNHRLTHLPHHLPDQHCSPEVHPTELLPDVCVTH